MHPAMKAAAKLIKAAGYAPRMDSGSSFKVWDGRYDSVFIDVKFSAHEDKAMLQVCQFQHSEELAQSVRDKLHGTVFHY